MEQGRLFDDVEAPPPLTVTLAPLDRERLVQLMVEVIVAVHRARKEVADDDVTTEG